MSDIFGRLSLDSRGRQTTIKRNGWFYLLLLSVYSTKSKVAATTIY